MVDEPWTIVTGEQPILATAIHNGHAVRHEVAQLMVLPEADRLREEDPFVGQWAVCSKNRIVVHVSRFEVDLNRPREKAVYLTPEDCWGLNVWSSPPSGDVVERSLAVYDNYYAVLKKLLSELAERHKRFVVLDIHSYNHRRGGPDAGIDDPDKNPEVNIGTGTMERERWANVVDGFMDQLSSFNYMGRELDVRENVKFKGGFMSQWVHENFPESGCCLAIEFKKFFMDEWTGEPYPEHLDALRMAMDQTIPRLLAELKVSVGS